MRIEHWWFMARLRVRSVFCRSRMERELHEEFEFHLEHKIAEGIARGLSPSEARLAALRAMDGLTQRKEETRDMWHVRWFTELVDDGRYAVRSLRRTPGIAAFVALALALGVGMTAATFSMVDGLVLRPYPVPHSSGVLTLAGVTHDKRLNGFSYREYLDIRSRTQNFAGVVARTDMQAIGFTAVPGATPRVRGGAMVSANYFRVLGVEPHLGRAFREEEDRVPGRDAVVVLGPQCWKNDFARDPSAVGRTIRLNGRDFTVIGVAPETFSGMEIFAHPDFYIPLAMAPVFSTNLAKNFFEDRDDRELTVYGRLQPGVTLAQARNQLAVLAKSLALEYPNTNRNRGASVYTQFEARTLEDQNWRFGVIFLLLSLAVLLVACTNVAGLLLSRSRARTREIAVRLAIGAGRFRLVRLLLTEGVILASFGGLCGVAAGYGIIRWFQTKRNIIFNSDLPVGIPFQMDTRVLLAALAVSAVSAVVCSLAPALAATRTDLVSGLKSADVELPGRKRFWGRNTLVVAQVATSLMLLTAAFLMARNFQRGVIGGAGFPQDHLLMVTFDTRLDHYDATQSRQFYRLLTERVRQAPGVRSAALTESVPLGYNGYEALEFVPEGFQMPRDRESFSTTMDTVDESYFETMGIPILRGRGFLKSDTAGTARVAVVNEQLAKYYWPGGDAIGRRIRLNRGTGAPVEIVGIARTIKYFGSTEKPRDFAYLPLAQHQTAELALMVRSAGNPRSSIEAVKNIVRGIDANMPMLGTMAYEDFYRNMAVNGPQIAIDLVGSMGAAGLLLAVAGLYGLVAYNAGRKTREIGIRMALGAGRPDVLRLVMGAGLALVGIGMAIGLAMGLAVERFMNSMLFGSGGIDVAAYLVVLPLLLAVTMLAAYVPARKASRIAPTQALRYE